MKVLFVGREKEAGQLSPIILAQGESLVEEGIEVSYFQIKGQGVRGYLRSGSELRRWLAVTQYDIIHAHYYLSGIISAIAGARPLVVSLMGSDLKSNSSVRCIINFFNRFFWSAVIVKTHEMAKQIKNTRHNYVIPNGVNLSHFTPLNREDCLKKTGFNTSRKHILFLADPSRKEKNFTLASEAVRILNDTKIEFHVLSGISYEAIPVYMTASDVLLLTSLHEGSPNVIKEAMACNLPIVSTKVGDVNEIIGKTAGCYLADFDAADVAVKISEALSFNSRTEGRRDIGHLSSGIIAKQIVELYENLI